MFQFTHDCTEEQIAQSWCRHFGKVGRAAGIVSLNNNLSVWRSGKGIRGAGKTVEEYEDEPRGTLLCAVNGFEQEWLIMTRPA